MQCIVKLSKVSVLQVDVNRSYKIHLVVLWII